MTAFKCKMCGGELNITEGINICECAFCGTQQTIPIADNDKKVNLFNRANRLRMNAEFDKAAAVYATITAEFPEEAEAYWGLCLCKYGIEYVDDSLTGSKIPTCHRTLTNSIMDDSDFDQACENADPDSKRLYREEAKAIDKLQQDILSIVASEEPFDVFICYKETDETGERTDDSVLAQDIYDFLTEKGLKVFFARITLEDKLGQQYEPYIYAALHSAKVMLAVGTKFEYFDAVWVKNEWARYLDMMKSDKSKTLIPCFKGIDAYDMPREFKNLQALDMDKIGWKQDLVRGIKKLTREEEKPKQEIIQTIVGAGTNVENLMKRIRLFLEDGEYAGAKDYIEKVLDENAEYAPAYIARVCIALGINQEEDLKKAPYIFDQNPDWKKAIRFATKQQREVYEDYIGSTIVEIEKKILLDNLTIDQCQKSVKQLEKYSQYKKVAQQIEEIKAIEEELQRRVREAEEEKNKTEKEMQKKILDEELRIRVIEVAEAQKEIKSLKEKHESRKKEYASSIELLRKQTLDFNAIKRNIEARIEQSKERTLQLLNEELNGVGKDKRRGLFSGKRNELVEQRKEEEEKQDKLRKLLAEEEKKYLSEQKVTKIIKPDDRELIYSVAKVYYDHELYAEALEEYKKILEYKNVKEILEKDPNLQGALEKENE